MSTCEYSIEWSCKYSRIKRLNKRFNQNLLNSILSSPNNFNDIKYIDDRKMYK